MNQQRSFGLSFVILTVLFFLWGLLTSLNDILVPHLKAVFDLKHWQAQLIQFFFFGAYFIMSIPAGMIIRRLGYKGGIVAGLSLMGLGCLLFYPASTIQEYGIFLVALFILASGITILQVAANPYVAILGPEETAASRLNLAQGFNSLGHTIAPLLGAWLILQNTAVVDVKTVQGPYLVMAVVLLLIALVFRQLPLPSIEYQSDSRKGFRLLDYPHLYLGAIAIFCYVGAEIAIGSFLVEYFRSDPTIALATKTAGSYVAFYWGGAMVGRFMGAIALSDQQHAVRKSLYMALIPLIGFGAALIVLTTNGGDTRMAFGFLVVMLLNYGAFFLGKGMPAQILMIFAATNIVLLIITMNTGGTIAIWSVLAIGLFNSIMWSNIFTMAIERLREFTSIGSSLLVMMIVGGAIIPPLQGLAADIPGIGVKFSFIVPAIAYAYLTYYGWRRGKTPVPVDSAAA
ncbi:MAG: sugar MFS transporter [Lewinellaceae bacterium]|nr:sugar MFS transporter [Lewinellaceae bacterium]